MSSVIERIRKRMRSPLDSLVSGSFSEPAARTGSDAAKAALRVTQHWMHYGVGAVFVMGQLVALGARAAREAHDAH